MALLQKAMKPPKMLTSLPTGPPSAVRAHAIAGPCFLPHSTAASCMRCTVWHRGLSNVTIVDASLRMHARTHRVRELCRCGGVMASSSG